MRINRHLCLVAVMMCVTVIAHAQTARGIIAAPDMVMDPAEGVYELQHGRLSLFSFCIGQVDGFPTLIFPDEGGKKMEESVKELFPYAYEVSVSHLPDDPYYRSRSAVLSQLEKAVASAKSGDVVMLYFSGHGVLADNIYVGKEYYFITSDTNVNDPQRTAVSGAEIRGYVEKIASRGAFVFVFADTCHSEALFPSTLGTGNKGGMAFFASSSADSPTIENGFLRSTDFTEALLGLLAGNNITGDLTVEAMASVLGAPTSGNVQPKLINAGGQVLLRSIDKKQKYHQLIDRYKDYISKGRAAVIRGEYSRAFFEFSEARYMERGLRTADRIDYSEDISALNRAVSDAIAKNTGLTSSSAWKNLSLINEQSYGLDRTVVDLQALFLGSGQYFYEEGDYKKAFSFFKKAYNQGNRDSAAFFMAKIAKEKLPGTLSKQEVERLYTEARTNGYDTERNEKAQKELIRLAESGDLNAQALLGRCYFKGDTLGFEKDYDQAVTWLKKASVRKHPDATCYLGHCFRKGRGVPKDEKKAHSLYKTSASLGSLLGEYNVAMDEYYGIGVKKNQKKAFKTFKSLSDRNYPRGKEGLALCYEEGEVVRKDTVFAYQLYLKAAEMGYDAAQTQMGYYYSVLNSPADYEKGLFWFNKAAEQKNALALFDLGVAYENGLGVQENEPLAFYYFTQASKYGSAHAMKALSYYYLYGVGVEPDIKMAELWMKKAAEEDKQYMNQLGDLYLKVGRAYLGYKNLPHLIQQDDEEGFKYLKIAESLGVSEDNTILLFYSIGHCYQIGNGVEINGMEAYKYLKKAADLGDGDSMNDIGVLYSEGNGVKKDMESSTLWYRKAAEAGNVWGLSNLGSNYLEMGDTLTAFSYFKEAAEKGHRVSLQVVGDYYYYGLPGVTQSDKEAQICYEKAYERGERQDISKKLGRLYRKNFINDWKSSNYDSAYKWCQKGMDIGYPMSWYDMSEFYFRGQVVEQDFKKGYQLMVESYEKGCREEVVTKNIQKAYSWLFARAYRDEDYQGAMAYGKKAVDLGAADELYWIGYMYYTGRGAEKDRVKMIGYFEMAYKKKDALSESVRKYLAQGYYDLFETVFKEGKDYSQALLWCERSAELGDARAKNRLPSARKLAKQ